MSAGLSPAMIEELAAVARAADAAEHGGKTAVYAAAAQRLGISVATLIKRLKAVAPGKPRKRRSDAGRHALSRDEALLIAATVIETRRQTDTGELALERAVDILRRNGTIQAGRVDETTGEFLPLSLSAIRRAMASYSCHPEQLAQPTAAVSIASAHPNHLWQIDASVSRQYYLADSGTEVMDASVYYRGKPANFIKINDRRLIRYTVVDHCSGHIRLFYVQGSESSLGVVSALIHAMTPCEGIAMHGVPAMVWMDKGSLSALVEAFLTALAVEYWAHAAGNPRAIGSGEQSHNLTESTFEAPLKLRKPVLSIEEMNRLATQWCRWYNATRVHSRTGMSRRDGWLRITPEQLRPAPPVKVLRELATSAPKACKVRDLQIKFRSAVWDVSQMPGVLNGATVQVSVNAYDPDSVRVQVTGEDGQPAHYLAPRVELNEWGFAKTAARAGEEFASKPETPADKVRREIERLAMQAETDDQAAANRKAKRVAFGGEVDPTLPWTTANIPPALPRAGTPLDVQAPTVIAPRPDVPSIQPHYEAPLLDHTEMAMALRRRVTARGGEWTAELYARMAERWPDGVTEDQLDECAVQLLRGGLRAVGGGAS